MNRTILHSDCNCFYASVELLHHPELRGKPVAVGGDPEARHGIVLTADYTAKRYGVKTGMALWQAKQICQEIIFVPPRMDLYLRFSRMAQEIYADYTDKREPYGIDESWLDVTDSATLKGDGFHIAQEISSRMKKELGITVSVGVSFNKIFAKLGSDYKKPDAITTMYEDEFQRKAWCLPVSDLLYVGNATNKKLYSMGIRTIGDLAESDETLLVRKLGKIVIGQVHIGQITHSVPREGKDSAQTLFSLGRGDSGHDKAFIQKRCRDLTVLGTARQTDLLRIESRSLPASKSNMKIPLSRLPAYYTTQEQLSARNC